MIFTYYAAAYKEDWSVELVEMVEKLLVVKRSPSLALNMFLLFILLLYLFIIIFIIFIY